MDVRTNNEKEFAVHAKTFAKGLEALSDKALVVALVGELGAGKTTFTKYIAEALGATTPVQSPTFVLLRQYQISKNGLSTLLHIDGYRFDTPEEGNILTLKERIRDKKLLFMIEWPEKFGDLLPKPDITVYISHEGGEARRIKTA